MWRLSRVFNVSSNVIAVTSPMHLENLIVTVNSNLHLRNKVWFSLFSLNIPASSLLALLKIPASIYLAVTQGILYCTLASNASLLSRGFRIAYCPQYNKKVKVSIQTEYFLLKYYCFTKIQFSPLFSRKPLLLGLWHTYTISHL